MSVTGRPNSDFPASAGFSLRVGSPLEAGSLETPAGTPAADARGLRLRLEHARLRLVRGFEELLCLNGLNNVEHLPHQIETVRRVLRHFRGRVLLADEVGLGKTIEACLLLKEYLARGRRGLARGASHRAGAFARGCGAVARNPRDCAACARAALLD